MGRSIRVHLFTGYLSALALLVAAWFAAGATTSALRGSYAHTVRTTDTLTTVILQASKLRDDEETGLRGYLLTGRPVFLQPYRAAAAQLPALSRQAWALAAAEPDVRPALLARLAAADAWDRWARGVLAGPLAAPRSAAMVAQQERGKALFDGLRTATDRLLRLLDADRQAAFRASMDRLRTLDLLFAALFAAAAGVLALLSWRTMDAVVRPLRALGRAADAIGHGDLAHPVVVAGAREFARLGGAMDAMRRQLRAREGSLREEGARLAGIVATQQDVALADLDMRVIMPLIATRARTLTGADGAVVELVEGDELVYHAVAGTMEGYLGTRLPRDGTLSGLAVRTGETLHCVDTATDPRTDSALCRRLGIGSMVVVPLRHGGRDVGVLKVLSSATHAFDERTVQTLQLVAGVLGAALGQGAAFAAVHASEERFRSVTESAHDAIVVADSRGGIVSWNAGARAIFGYQDDEVLGQPVTILLSEAYRAAHQRGVERLAARGTSRVMGQTLSLEGQRKDGAVFPLESSLATWTTAEGVFYSGIMRDVTERRQAENRLAATARTLEAKTREQEALIYTMSHDLKAPLVSLQGMAGVLLEDYADQLDHEARRYLDRIAANARKMQLLIDELLELSRVGRDAAETTPVALDAVVAAATEQLGHTLAARGAEVRVEGPLPRVPANATRLAQVFTNLIHNAIMYTPADRAPRVTIAARAAGDCWEISVHDNGVGIPAAFHDKIFQVFQRLPEGKSLNPGGSGAGLAIVARVVEAHGGRIWLESVAEQGTTFYFTLPTGAAAGDGRPPHTAVRRHAAPVLTNHDTLRTDAERVRR